VKESESFIERGEMSVEVHTMTVRDFKAVFHASNDSWWGDTSIAFFEALGNFTSGEVVENNIASASNGHLNTGRDVID
jgi:hypothetical protein